jgi:hypothetical protein
LRHYDEHVAGDGMASVERELGPFLSEFEDGPNTKFDLHLMLSNFD